MPRRILICSASVGAGHGRAAEAIFKALAILSPDTLVRHVDILQYTNFVFRRTYGQGYFDAIDLFPDLVHYFYDRLDRPPAHKTLNGDLVWSWFARANFGRFLKLLQSEPWDLAINTHFLPPDFISHLRSDGRVNFPQMTVTTDFDVHRIWTHNPCEAYTTATEEGRINLGGWGAPLERITTTGIPIDPLFTEQKDAAACRKLHDIIGQRPVLLQMSGGQGVGPAEQVHRRILDVATPLEIISVAGHNEKLKKKLEAIPCPPRHRRKILGFTDKMDELMAAADLLVSKPGGLTTSEALARGLAMIVIDPIPGQEDRNCDFLLEQGAALKVNNLASLTFKISEVVDHPERLASLRAGAAKAGRPQAAFDVARIALKLLEVAPQAAPAGQRRSFLSRLRGLRKNQPEP